MLKAVLTSLIIVLFATPALAADKETAYAQVLKTDTLRCAYTSVSTHVTKDFKTGEVTGLMVDIATAMAGLLQLKIEWVAEVGHADFAEGLKTGRYDAYCGILAMAPTRARVADFTMPLFYNPYYAYVRADETRFKYPADLNRPNVKAGVIDGEVFQLMTQRFLPHAQEVGLPNMTSSGQLFVDLAGNKTDAVIHDSVVEKDYDRNNPGKVKRAFDKPFDVYPMAFAVAPEEIALKNMLNTAILVLHMQGKIDALLTKYGIDGMMTYRAAPPYQTP